MGLINWICERGNNRSARLVESLISEKTISSSCLKENNKIYSAEKITYWGNLNYVWAVRNKDSGMGEYIVLENVRDVSTLYFLPGYISIKRPDLYEKNARPKKIKISTEIKDYEFCFDDIPKYQKFDFFNSNKWKHKN